LFVPASNNQLRVDAIEFAVLKTLEDVFDPIRPTQVRRVPTEEVLVPVFREAACSRSPPSSRNGVTFEVDIKAALFGFGEELIMEDLRVLISSRNRLVRLS
jgi:hypothetical protein